MQRADSLEKILMLEKIEGKKNKGVKEDEMVRQHHWLNGGEFEQTPQESDDREAWHVAVHEVIESDRT